MGVEVAAAAATQTPPWTHSFRWPQRLLRASKLSQVRNKVIRVVRVVIIPLPGKFVLQIGVARKGIDYRVKSLSISLSSPIRADSHAFCLFTRFMSLAASARGAKILWPLSGCTVYRTFRKY
jgi:hypothetical protein